ncbi:uncharacterized protein DUF2793 [Mesorhizobium loti]|uniref:Uncharacterized protein DUF2793 n=1 Tax=Rhizobium loti TaxID=381 RepID=A0A8E3B6T7_RHILI|nr:DUF2793 domain-containing protein [Mesorhizobium loti]PWJ93515.1 uncharacterized protein DUF2793 [Mesorhizobium loti]
MTTSNRLGITELAETQNNRHTTVNEAVAKLEAGAALYGCVSVGDTSPPGSPAEGDQYVLGGSPTGAWSGHGEAIANFFNGAWQFIPALPGAQAYAADEDAFYYYDVGGTWVLVGSSGGLGNVTGPGSSVSGNIATFNGTDGQTIQDGGVAISTDGTMASASDAKVTTEKGIKTYVDGKVTGLSWKQAVRAATTVAGTLASSFENGDAIDGVTLATGDRILIKNQSSASENGIYTVNASGAPTRATDADAGAELVNASVYVSEGTTLADTQWTCTTNAPITVGSTSLAFAQAGIGGFTAASTTEVLTGTDTSKGVTADALAALWEKGADVASATTTALGEGGFFHITGTTTITDIDWATAKDGRVAWVIFDGILTLTHNATTLKLPGGANITTAAGDRACFAQDASDNVICLYYTRADGTAVVSGAATGKQTIWVPASAMLAATTNGPSTGQVETSSNKVNFSVLDFDATTAEQAWFDIAMPKGWDEGTVTFQAWWTTSATDTDGVAISLAGVAMSDNEALDTAVGTPVVVTDDAQSGALELLVTAESSAVTIAGSPVEGDLCLFRVQRVVSDGNDDMSEDMRLIGIKLFYTTNAANDA